LTQKGQPSGAGVMVVMQLAWHWQKINKMCLNVEFQLPLLLIGITMVSYGKTPAGTKMVDKLLLGYKVKKKFSLCLINQASCHDDV
jgi:hypothetical protein